MVQFKKKKISFLVILTLMLCFFSGASFGREGENFAEQPDELSGETISLAQLLTYAAKNNPSIQEAMARWRNVVEKYRVVTALPDPQFMVTWFPSPIETRLGPQEWNATLSQGIPFPGKRFTAGKIVETDAAAAKLSVDARAREVAANITRSYHELYYIDTARDIARNNAVLLDKLRQMAEVAHADDQALLMDVVKARSQAGQLQYDIVLLEELARTEKTTLNALLNRPPQAPLGSPRAIADISMDCPLDFIYDRALAHGEAIAIAGLQVQKAALDVELSRFSQKPDFKLGFFYAAIGDPDVAMPPADAGKDAVGIQFGMNIPLWGDKNKGTTARARAGVARQKAVKSRIINQTRTAVQNLYFKLTNSRRLMTLYGEDLLIQAEKSLDLAMEWFREGQGSFSDALEAQSAVYNFQLSLARARADYGKALAELERLAGGRLSRCDTPPDNSDDETREVRHE